MFPPNNLTLNSYNFKLFSMVCFYLLNIDIDYYIGQWNQRFIRNNIHSIGGKINGHSIINWFIISKLDFFCKINSSI